MFNKKMREYLITPVVSLYNVVFKSEVKYSVIPLLILYMLLVFVVFVLKINSFHVFTSAIVLQALITILSFTKIGFFSKTCSIKGLMKVQMTLFLMGNFLALFFVIYMYWYWDF